MTKKIILLFLIWPFTLCAMDLTTTPKFFGHLGKIGVYEDISTFKSEKLMFRLATKEDFKFLLDELIKPNAKEFIGEELSEEDLEMAIKQMISLNKDWKSGHSTRRLTWIVLNIDTIKDIPPNTPIGILNIRPLDIEDNYDDIPDIEGLHKKINDEGYLSIGRLLTEKAQGAKLGQELCDVLIKQILNNMQPGVALASSSVDTNKASQLSVLKCGFKKALSWETPIKNSLFIFQHQLPKKIEEHFKHPTFLEERILSIYIYEAWGNSDFSRATLHVHNKEKSGVITLDNPEEYNALKDILQAVHGSSEEIKKKLPEILVEIRSGSGLELELLKLNNRTITKKIIANAQAFIQRFASGKERVRIIGEEVLAHH